jgi:hypothetical protein
MKLFTSLLFIPLLLRADFISITHKDNEASAKIVTEIFTKKWNIPRSFISITKKSADVAEGKILTFHITKKGELRLLSYIENRINILRSFTVTRSDNAQ